MPIHGISQGNIALPGAAPRVEDAGSGRRESDKRQQQRDMVSISPLGSDLLELESGQGATAVDALSAKVDELTRRVSSAVLESLADDGLEPGSRLVLRVEEDVLRAEEGQDAVEASLQRRPELAQGVQELAHQSGVLQTVQSTSARLGRQGGVHAYAQGAGLPPSTPEAFRLAIVDGQGIGYFTKRK